MASTTDIGFSSQETKVVFSGVGTIVLVPLATGPYFVGGSGVDETTGIEIPNGGTPLTLYVTSPDDVYVHCNNSSGSLRVYHNR